VLIAEGGQPRQYGTKNGLRERHLDHFFRGRSDRADPALPIKPVESKTPIPAGIQQVFDEADHPAARGAKHGAQQICQR
jgi:hypothetical protein